MLAIVALCREQWRYQHPQWAELARWKINAARLKRIAVNLMDTHRFFSWQPSGLAISKPKLWSRYRLNVVLSVITTIYTNISNLFTKTKLSKCWNYLLFQTRWSVVKNQAWPISISYSQLKYLNIELASSVAQYVSTSPRSGARRDRHHCGNMGTMAISTPIMGRVSAVKN